MALFKEEERRGEKWSHGSTLHTTHKRKNEVVTMRSGNRKKSCPRSPNHQIEPEPFFKLNFNYYYYYYLMDEEEDGETTTNNHFQMNQTNK